MFEWRQIINGSMANLHYNHADPFKAAKFPFSLINERKILKVLNINRNVHNEKIKFLNMRKGKKLLLKKLKRDIKKVFTLTFFFRFSCGCCECFFLIELREEKEINKKKHDNTNKDDCGALQSRLHNSVPRESECMASSQMKKFKLFCKCNIVVEF